MTTLTAVIPVACQRCGAHVHVLLTATHHPGHTPDLQPDPADLIHAQLFAERHAGPITVAGQPTRD